MFVLIYQPFWETSFIAFFFIFFPPIFIYLTVQNEQLLTFGHEKTPNLENENERCG